MSTARPGVLRIGARVRFDGTVQTVAGLSRTLVRLAGQDGRASVVQLAHLLASEGFEVIGGADRTRPPLSAAVLGGVPGQAVGDALQWERHIVGVLTGVPADAPPGTVARPGYDLAVCSLVQREQAKAAELTASGEKVTARTVRRKRQRYQACGLAGLVDWRTGPSTPARGRTDERVVAALQQAISEQAGGSTRTASFYLWRTRQILAGQHGPDVVPMPARATFYRLFERVTEGLHTTGSARTRQSLANRPGRPFSRLAASRPGEVVEIDSTPFDVMVLLDDGVTGRAELTGMVDLATRTVTAAVLRPTTKLVDASLLLARTVTPEPMRPGWADALSMARSVLPHQRLLGLDQRLAHAAARPVVVPETIVCDHGKAFISQNFRSSCRTLGITFQPAHPRTPTDKPHLLGPGPDQGADRTAQLPIEGLRGQDARALLETVLTGPVDAQVREELIAEAGDNPLALLELPRGLAPAQLAGGFGLPGVLPRSGSIEETFQRRVGAVPADARRLLLLAAAEPAGQPHGRETTRPAHPGGTVPASAQPAARTRAGAPPANRERRPLSPGLAGHARDRPQAFVTSEAAGRRPRPGRPSRGACDPRARRGEVVQDA